MTGKHAQKYFGTVGAMAPTLLSLKTRDGRGGCRIQVPGPVAPPPSCSPQWDVKEKVKKSQPNVQPSIVALQMNTWAFVTLVKHHTRSQLDMPLTAEHLTPKPLKGGCYPYKFHLCLALYVQAPLGE